MAGMPVGETDRPLECGVLAHGVVQADRAGVDRLRQDARLVGLGPGGGRFLRRADDQSVAGLAAVVEAIGSGSWGERDFREWAVVAAPQFVGRGIAAPSLKKFLAEGPASVSPHLIPSYSSHSLSGTISVALGIQGPNFGAGGGPGAVVEGLMAGCTLLGSHAVAGVWLVLTQWEPVEEPAGRLRRVDEQSPPSAATCHALALALVPVEQGTLRLRASLPLAGLQGQSAAWRQPLSVIIGHVKRWAGSVAGADHQRLLLVHSDDPLAPPCELELVRHQPARRAFPPDRERSTRAA